MKKKLFIFLAAAIFSGAAARPALGGDVPERPASSGKAQRSFDPHSRALEYHIAGLLEKDPQKKVTCFLQAVHLDPLRKAPLLQLVKALPQAPGRAKEVCEKLSALRQKYPQDLFLTLQYSIIAARTGVSPAENLKVITPLLRKKPAPFEQSWYTSLAFCWVDLVLTQGGRFTLPPFETDHPELLAAAFFYSSVSCLRESFSDPGTASLKQLEKYTALLLEARPRSREEFRKMMAVVFAVKAYGTAYKMAEKWYVQNKDPYSALTLIDAAARSGQLRRLELLLKKYPALAKDFCTKRRIEACIASGDLSRAYEETANFANRTEQLLIRLDLAVKQRNASLACQLLEQVKKLPRSSKDIIAFEQLRIAEFSKNKQLLAAAKKHFALRLKKDPMLANSAAYVSAELDTDLDEAQQLLEFALSRAPRNAAYLDSMAWLLFRKKEYQKAALYIEKGFRYLDFSAGGAVMADHAGEIYSALGQKQKALRFYLLADRLYKQNRALNADLDFKALRKKIAGLTSGKNK